MEEALTPNTHSRPARRHLALAAAALASLTLPTWAAQPGPVVSLPRVQALTSMPAAQARAQLRKHFKTQARRTATQGRGATPQSTVYDDRAPTLTSLTAGTTVNVQNPLNRELTVNLRVRDNLAGLQSVIAYAQGPNGQVISSAHGFEWPVGSERVVLKLLLNDYSAPGAWQVTDVVVSDINGNSAYYDAAALSALGNTAFTVLNRNTLDTVAPVLDGASAITPTVSVGTPPRGNLPGVPARVAVQIQASDPAEDPATPTHRESAAPVSGLAWASIGYCNLELGYCFWLSGEAPIPGASPSSFAISASLWNGLPPGTYHATDAYVGDRFGNSRYYAFEGGGESGLLGTAASITLVP